MNRRISVSIALAITIIAMTVTFSITWIVSMHTFDNTVSAVTRLQAQYQKLSEIDSYVRSNFSGTIDDNTLFDRVALGYVNGLGDRYSVYYTEKEYSELVQVENGTLVGLGMEFIREADGRFRIVRVYDNSPAQRAGVTVGGYLTGLNGEDTKSFTTVAALKSSLYGEEGTEDTLQVTYAPTDVQDFPVRRINFAPPIVESQRISNGDYLYVRISSFAQDPVADIASAVNAAVEDGAIGIVFDVRGNSEGPFRNAYEVIDYLCPVGTVAKSVAKNGTVRVLATSDEEAIDLPMAVVVDETTAGAAELFAASLRDLNGGHIVGMGTAGHGTIQSTPYRLQDGSAISVTISNLLTGRDEDFDGVGIAPDFEVEDNMAERTVSKTKEEYLYNITPTADGQVRRALEVVRNTVIENGGNPDPITFETPVLVAEAPDGVLVEQDGSVLDEDTSDAGEAGGDDSSTDEEDSSSSSGT